MTSLTNSGVPTGVPNHLDALWTPNYRPEFWHVRGARGVGSLIPANASFTPSILYRLQVRAGQDNV